MSKAATKTDNSYFETKIRLRIDNLPEQKEISVLDCFAGDGLIWVAIQDRLTDRSISVLPIDKQARSGRLKLIGDNMKFIGSMDLTSFDVIDLDAHGIPIEQLRLVLTRPLKHGVILHITFIQIVIGELPLGFLSDLGYPQAMVSKIKTMFFRNGPAKLIQWLSLNGVKKVKYWSKTSGSHSTMYLCTRIG